MDGLIADVNLLFENCNKFNAETSEIVHIANNLKDDIFQIIYPDAVKPSQQIGNEPSLLSPDKHSDIIATTTASGRRGRGGRLTRYSQHEEQAAATPDLFDLASLEESPMMHTRTSKRKRTTSQDSSEEETFPTTKKTNNGATSSSRPSRKSSRFTGTTTQETSVYYFEPEEPINTRKRKEMNRIDDDSDENEEVKKKPTTRGAKASVGGRSRTRSQDDDEDESAHSSAESDEEEENANETENDDESSDEPRGKGRRSGGRPTRNVSNQKQKVPGRKEVTPPTSSQRTAQGRGRRARTRTNSVSEDEEESEAEESDEDEEEDQQSEEDYGRKRSSRTGTRKPPASTRSSSRLRPKGGDSGNDSSEQENSRRSNSTIRRSSRRTSGKAKNYSEDYNEEDDVDQEEEEEEPQHHTRHGRTIKTPANIMDIYSKEKEEKEFHKQQLKQKEKELQQKTSIPANTLESSLHRKRIDPELKKIFHTIILKIEDFDSEYQFFANPVDPTVALGYYDIVQNPMDISNIR
jgi:hypothetical protein